MARLYLRKTLNGITDVHGRNPATVAIEQRFGRLRVVAMTRIGSDRQRRYTCQCECGQLVEVRSNCLTSNRTRSCGCLRREKGRNKTHGFNKSNRTYRIWMGMRDRCNRAKSPIYKYYGGRGIRVCDRWNDFEKFLEDMGEAPPDKSLDRIDNDGNYEPVNCRWATRKQQVANRRPNGTALSP